MHRLTIIHSDNNATTSEGLGDTSNVDAMQDSETEFVKHTLPGPSSSNVNASHAIPQDTGTRRSGRKSNRNPIADLSRNLVESHTCADDDCLGEEVSGVMLRCRGPMCIRPYVSTAYLSVAHNTDR